jgi:NAD(P)H-dependent FMN reductase
MLLRAAAESVPDGSTVEIASIRGIPLYDADLEAESIPEPVQELKAKIVAADALLLVTPEYNNSIPGVMKNAVDWLSRPPADVPRVFGGRPIGLMGATPGVGGTSLAQAAWLPVLRTLGTSPWFGGRLMVANAAQTFDADGKLIDDMIRGRLLSFMKGFVAYADERKR